VSRRRKREGRKDVQRRVDVEEKLAADVVTREFAEMDLVEAVTKERVSSAFAREVREWEGTHTTPSG
jgi:hypothetical protein